MAQLYYVGREVEKNTYSAPVLYSHAVEFNPSPNCAYEYGRLAFYGDMGDPPSFQPRPGEGLKWIRHAAERGHYFAMTSYADILELRREYRQAEKWLKKAIKIEPKVLSGSAKRQLDRVRRKNRK